jgi:2,4-dienoyl-CoA reductase-like NADH-dependent reductase (Old Yellow Enzyme family)
MEKGSVGPMTHLVDPLAIRDITFANRVFVSPMSEYSSMDGYANDWHFVHLGSRARRCWTGAYRSHCSSS